MPPAPRSPFLGLYTVIYHAQDLARARVWYARAFGIEPYFDEPYYVGFNVGGCELGLDPDPAMIAPGAGGEAGFRAAEIGEPLHQPLPRRRVGRAWPGLRQPEGGRAGSGKALRRLNHGAGWP